MKILKIEVGKAPTIKEIPNTLTALQSEVGGLIEPICLGDGCLLVGNEEGKINGMAPNRWLGTEDIVCGPFFICGDDGEDFTSLTDQQIEKYSEVFSEVPVFSGEEPELNPRATIIGFDFMKGM